MIKLKGFFENHKNLKQISLFLLFSFLALSSQIISRFIFDLCFQNANQNIVIWPFDIQTIGSLFAFLLSNIIAKIVTFIANRKKTFSSNNNLAFSIVAYIILVVALIIVETIIGTPLQNAIYITLGGKFTGEIISYSSALNGGFYQICGAFSQMLYGIGDAIIVFISFKYVIMKKTNSKVTNKQEKILN